MSEMLTEDKNKSELCLIHLQTSRKRKHLEVYIQSDILEDFTKALKMNENNSTWLGNYGYYVPSLPYQMNNYSRCLRYWKGDLMVTKTLPNMSFILGMGLRDGLTFKIKQPYSREELNRFNTLFPKFVKAFFVEWCQYLNRIAKQNDITINDLYQLIGVLKRD